MPSLSSNVDNLGDEIDDYKFAYEPYFIHLISRCLKPDTNITMIKKIEEMMNYK